MAISTKKKNIIRAMWKTGKFKSFTAIAKHYKISTKTAQKIIGETAQSNADIVEKAVEVEMFKKSTKNPHEIKAIEKVVEERVSTIEIDNQLIINNRRLLKETQASIAEYFIPNEEGKRIPLDPLSIKQITGAVKDIESVANPKDNSTKIDIKNQNNVVIPTMEDLYK